MIEQQVDILLVEELADGTKRIGNSLTLGISEAIAMIEVGMAAHPNYSIGFVPPEWTVNRGGRKKANEAVGE